MSNGSEYNDNHLPVFVSLNLHYLNVTERRRKTKHSIHQFSLPLMPFILLINLATEIWGYTSNIYIQLASHIYIQYKRIKSSRQWRMEISSSCCLSNYLPFHCSSTIVLVLFVKFHRVQASSVRVQARSCVNFGEQNWIWVAPEICFQDSDFCHSTTTFFYLSYLSKIYYVLLLIFPTIWKKIYLFNHIWKYRLCDFSMYHVRSNCMERITRCPHQWDVKEGACESSNKLSSNLR